MCKMRIFFIIRIFSYLMFVRIVEIFKDINLTINGKTMTTFFKSKNSLTFNRVNKLSH